MNRINLVLIVDDDEVSNFISKTCISHSGVVEEVVVKLNGLEAAKYFDECKGVYPDLVFIDINMPLMNGFELLQYLKKANYRSKSRFVILSTSDHSEDKAAALKFDNVIDFVEKPLSPELIKKLIGKLD